MPMWTPKPVWKGHDVYIIGGGASLRGFPWGCLRNKHVIGINFAHRLGSDIVDFCVFCDVLFYRCCKEELERFDGMVVANVSHKECLTDPWLRTIRRGPKGLSLKGTLGSMHQK